jgi:hypothetical protein
VDAALQLLARRFFNLPTPWFLFIIHLIIVGWTMIIPAGSTVSGHCLTNFILLYLKYLTFQKLLVFALGS